MNSGSGKGRLQAVHHPPPCASHREALAHHHSCQEHCSRMRPSCPQRDLQPAMPCTQAMRRSRMDSICPSWLRSWQSGASEAFGSTSAATATAAAASRSPTTGAKVGRAAAAYVCAPACCIAHPPHAHTHSPIPFQPQGGAWEQETRQDPGTDALLRYMLAVAVCCASPVRCSGGLEGRRDLPQRPREKGRRPAR